jgi:hypothetical protein
MSINLSWNLDLFDPTLTAIAEDNPEIPMFVDKITEAVSHQGPIPNRMKDSEFAGFPAMSELPEEGTPDELHPVKGHELETGYRQFGGRIVFSNLILEDDLTDVCGILVGKLRDSHAKLQEYQSAGIYVNGMDSTYSDGRYKVRGGQALFSIAHPATGGGPVRSNVIVDAAGAEESKAFGYESLQDLLTIMGRHTDHLGDPEPLRFDNAIECMVQYEDEFEFYKVLSQLSQYQPTDNTNAPNVVLQAQTFNSKPIMNPYIDAVGADGVMRPFYLFPKAGERPVQLVTKRAYAPRQYLENGNASMVHVGTSRYDFRSQDYRKAFASGF